MSNDKIKITDSLDFDVVSEGTQTQIEALLEDTNFYGYRHDLEKPELIKSKSIDPSVMMKACQGNYPEEIDPEKWHRIEMQGSMGSCQGHAQSSVLEMAYFIKTGRIIQFSPLFAYYATQQIDGLQGQDRGSTISGGVDCAKKYGACPLAEMPYPNPVRYRFNIPQHAFDCAKDYKAQSHMYCKTYEHVFTYIASGQGGVEIGVSWNNTCTPNSEGVLEDVNASSGGGHAVAFLGYTPRKDKDGRKYLKLANSWSENWGKRGWAEVAPRVVDKWLSSQWTVMVGISDLTIPNFRKVDYHLW